MWVQTSKNLKNGPSYMYISHYNLKQKKIITLKCVLSEFKERGDFHGVGMKGGYLGALVLERALKDS